MNLLLSIVSIAIIISCIKEYVHADKFIDNKETILELLSKEQFEDHYCDNSFEVSLSFRLSKRNFNSLVSDCGGVLLSLGDIGTFKTAKDENYEKFPEENDEGFKNFVFLDVPIDGIKNKIKKVVRITDKPFVQTKNAELKDLEDSIEYPNGLLIGDSDHNPSLIYIFTKTSGENTLSPLMVLELIEYPENDDIFS